MKVEKVQGNLYSLQYTQPSLRDRLSSAHIFQLALEAEHAGDELKAMDLYRRAIELNPQATGAMVNLGTIFFGQRELALAARYYRWAIEVDPDFTLAHFNLGNVLSELHLLEESTRHYLKAVELCPRYADAHFNLAINYFNAGDSELLAIKHFRLHLTCNDAPCWNHQSKHYIRVLQERLTFKIAPWRRPFVVS